MKKTIIALTLILLAACQRDNLLPESTSAAKDVYLQYADRKELTVALIGDYRGYNAVMLQAQTKEDWLRLCEEFGVQKNIDASTLDSTKVSSLTTVSKSSGTIRNVDSIFAASDALLQRMVDSVLQEALRSGKMSGNVVIDTTYSFTHREHYDQGVLVDSSTVTNLVTPLLDNGLLQIANRHGDSGYIIRDDSQSLTLWLFFYSTDAEKEQILNHVTSNNIQK
ncbi:MAG: hypothetical protein IJR26_05740 [Bacteroidales bacterium]|nr:hypothetical protein [Bacteroidales bacterium]